MPDQPSRPPIADAPLSVILVARADDVCLEEVVASWSAFLQERNRPSEILLVQDGGPELPGEMAERFPRLRMLRHPLPRGVGAALQTGILAAQYPLLAYAPADQQFQAKELARLLERIDKVDLVTGYRLSGPVPSWLAAWESLCHWLARIAIGYHTERSESWLGWPGWWRRRLARWIFGVKVQDAECPFRLFRREVFRRIPIQSTSPFAHVEILAKANHLGAWMDQAAVSWTPPKHGVERAPAKLMRSDAWQLFKDAQFGPVELAPESNVAEPDDTAMKLANPTRGEMGKDVVS